MIGQIIKSTYRILEELGRGTVSTAYVAGTRRMNAW